MSKPTPESLKLGLSTSAWQTALRHAHLPSLLSFTTERIPQPNNNLNGDDQGVTTAMRSLYTTLTTALVLLTTLHIGSATAQNCYYPDGNLTKGPDAACSSGGGACCPYQWECLSNGLCYLPTANYYGRYTCTDATWQSSSCPQLCTEGNTAVGDEALLQCSDGSCKLTPLPHLPILVEADLIVRVL